jgi:hypothetical protein
MCRGDDQAAASKVIAHQFRQPLLRLDVERRGRLVEQPKRPFDRDQTSYRQPPPLSCG